ncbi:hypothetical protein E2C01_062367 [Portunus trituberculatus]|uniref:Uncharacterized protein n=1 Tax=Portunus trituberculatus TaxID=210409 RepID=A0A5B7H7N4_PORTR|nr:hypothetical protein [Portunus trituberculatus]
MEGRRQWRERGGGSKSCMVEFPFIRRLRPALRHPWTGFTATQQVPPRHTSTPPLRLCCLRHSQKCTSELYYSSSTRHPALRASCRADGDNHSDIEKQLWLGKRGEAPGGALGAGVRRELFKGPPDEWPNGGRPVPATLCGPLRLPQLQGTRGGGGSTPGHGLNKW